MRLTAKQTDRELAYQCSERSAEWLTYLSRDAGTPFTVFARSSILFQGKLALYVQIVWGLERLAIALSKTACIVAAEMSVQRTCN